MAIKIHTIIRGIIMDTIQAIKERRSIRNFIDKKISEEILTDLIDCGRLAPTGYNRQPWKFVVVRRGKLKEKIANLASYGRFIKDAGACIAVFCDKKEALTLLEDACAATENIIIAAQSYGLGSCWVNSYQKEHSQKVEELLNVPEDMVLTTMIAVGYHEEPEKNNRNKKSLEEVLVWNEF